MDSSLLLLGMAAISNSINQTPTNSYHEHVHNTNIDYDKLADSIVKAEDRKQADLERRQAEKQQQEYRAQDPERYDAFLEAVTRLNQMPYRIPKECAEYIQKAYHGVYFLDPGPCMVEVEITACLLLEVLADGNIHYQTIGSQAGVPFYLADEVCSEAYIKASLKDKEVIIPVRIFESYFKFYRIHTMRDLINNTPYVLVPKSVFTNKEN